METSSIIKKLKEYIYDLSCTYSIYDLRLYALRMLTDEAIIDSVKDGQIADQIVKVIDGYSGLIKKSEKALLYILFKQLCVAVGSESYLELKKYIV